MVQSTVDKTLKSRCPVVRSTTAAPVSKAGRLGDRVSDGVTQKVQDRSGNKPFIEEILLVLPISEQFHPVKSKVNPYEP